MSKSGWRTVEVDPVFESLQSASKRTGFSVPTFRDLVATGTLAAFRISDRPGGAIRVKVADVDALMKPYIPAKVADVDALMKPYIPAKLAADRYPRPRNGAAK